MKYGSVCSGIEAASVAWNPLGWEASFLSEIEKFPREVLTHHYPTIPLHGDFTTIQKGMYEPIELLVGGTPCQSFSIAGLRGGLDDPRGNLMLEFGALARRLQPKWVVWENVTGVLSSNNGKDFGSFLAMLGELGYRFAYRVLDAQNFGVAQRRRRVFVVGCLGDWRSPAAVLFESESLSGNHKKSRGTQKDTSSRATKCFDRQRSDEYGVNDIASTLSARDYKSATDLITVYETHPADSRVKPMGDVCQTVTSRWGTGGGNVPIALHKRVRRLTPVESERLQGFPDNYTDIRVNCPSGARYKALGNSMAVPVMKWIGKRIQMVEEMQNDR